MRISDFAPDQTKSLTVSIPNDAIERFVEFSGDSAPLHTDPAFARNAGFDGPLVHGAYLTALVSRFVGMEFPGSDAILERMDIGFRAPCYAPTELIITGRVRQISEAVSTIVLDINISRTDGEIVASGKTWHRILDL